MGSDPISGALADFNGDNYLNIAVANIYTDNVGVFLGNGDGTFIQQTTYSTGLASQPYYVIVADFNNDNISDIAATRILRVESQCSPPSIASSLPLLSISEIQRHPITATTNSSEINSNIEKIPLLLMTKMRYAFIIFSPHRIFIT